jgi:hypothetical protein
MHLCLRMMLETLSILAGNQRPGIVHYGDSAVCGLYQPRGRLMQRGAQPENLVNHGATAREARPGARTITSDIAGLPKIVEMGGAEGEPTRQRGATSNATRRRRRGVRSDW